MPTIEELFRSKKLASGKTAQEQYDIRNTKATPITTYNPLLSYTPGVLQKLRSSTDKMKETKLESETSGLRILSTLSSPILYGTDIIRLTRKSSNLVDTMKGATNGDTSGGGLLGKIGKGLNTFASKIGIAFPEDIIPSKLYLNKDFNTGKDKGGEGSTMEALIKIKSKSGGNFLGNFLKGTFEGKPSSNGILGNAMDAAKTAVTKFALGSRKQGAQNLAQQSKEFSAVIDIGAGFTPIQFRYTPYDSLRKYSSTIDKTADDDSIDNRGDLSSLYNNFPFNSNPIGPDNTRKYSNTNVRKILKARFTADPDQLRRGIEVKRGMYTTLDHLNKMVSYPSNDGLTNSDPKGLQLDGYDFVTLKFWSVSKLAAVNFRATINGLSETLSPSWDPNRFIGNPFSFYTYNSIERTLTFNFKVYSLSYDEHKSAWQRLNFLTSLVYPQNYTNVSVSPPFIKFTLGDMFRNKEAFIETLTYTVDDNTPWDIGIDEETKNWKLPKIISVDVTLKLVENKFSTFGNRLYGYGGVDTNIDIEEDKNKQLNRDGSPKKREEGKKEDIKGDAKGNGKPAENPSTEQPKKARNPKGELVLKYKDYNIYKKETGGFRQMYVWDGDRLVRKGPETRSDTDASLIEYEKRAIDDIEEIRMRNLQQDAASLVTRPL